MTLFNDAADAIADWINGAPCTDPAYARSLVNRLSVQQIPDRTFVDDLGRRWEWCGGQPGTWAWRITDYGQRIAIARVQAAVIESLNTLGAALAGSNFKPFESSPIPDAEVAALLDELQITDRGSAVIESGLTLRQAHEIETGCTPDELCDHCRKYLGAESETQDGDQ